VACHSQWRGEGGIPVQATVSCEGPSGRQGPEKQRRRLLGDTKYRAGGGWKKEGEGGGNSLLGQLTLDL